MPYQVIPVDRGDVVEILNDVDRPEPRMVLSRCDRAPGYYCVTHQQRLANVTQLGFHVADYKGPHQIAAWCHAHGIEATPEWLARPTGDTVADDGVG